MKSETDSELGSSQEGSESEKEVEPEPQAAGLFSSTENFLREEDEISGLEDSDFEPPEYSSEESSSESSTDSETKGRKRKPKLPRVICNISCCIYDVIPEAARDLCFKISRLPIPEGDDTKRFPEFDLLW